MILILSVVYSLNQNKSSILYENQCYLESDQCVIQLQNSLVQISVENFPIQIEENISISVEHANQYVMQGGWLEGTNMYMGKTPLFIQNSETKIGTTVHQGNLFIGACSEPSMRWKLVIDLQNIETGQSHLLSIFFQTQI